VAMACFLLWASASGGAAAASDTQLAVRVADDRSSLQVEFRGAWPRNCVPRAGSIRMTGRDVYFQLAESEATCSGQAVPLLLRSEPLGLSGLDGDDALRIHVLGNRSGHTLGFALASLGGTRSILRPESGLWWPETGGEFESGGPGLGVQVEVQDDTLAVNLSGYDEVGRPTWWFGAVPMASRHSLLELNSLHGGSGPFDPYAAPKTVDTGGLLHIEWLGPARAVFWFTRKHPDGPGIELRPVSMTRFAFGTRPGESWQGEWLLLRAAAEGGSRAEVLQLAWVEGSTEGFELASEQGHRLQCERNPQRPDSPPTRCSLLSGGLEPVTEFSDIGLERLESSDGDVRIRLQRLDPLH